MYINNNNNNDDNDAVFLYCIIFLNKQIKKFIDILNLSYKIINDFISYNHNK